MFSQQRKQPQQMDLLRLADLCNVKQLAHMLREGCFKVSFRSAGIDCDRNAFQRKAAICAK